MYEVYQKKFVALFLTDGNPKLLLAVDYIICWNNLRSISIFMLRSIQERTVIYVSKYFRVDQLEKILTFPWDLKTPTLSTFLVPFDVLMKFSNLWLCLGIWLGLIYILEIGNNSRIIYLISISYKTGKNIE